MFQKKSLCNVEYRLSILYLWKKRQEETWSYSAKKVCQKGYGHRIRDLKILESFVQQYPDKTQAEMAELWPGMVSRRIIFRMLKKIDFTRKTKTFGYQERDGQKK